MNAHRLTRMAVAAFAVWTVVCLGAIAWQTLNNPMRGREEALNARLNGMVTFTDELPEPDKTPLNELRTAITGKTALWKELIAAPPAPPKPETDPNLKEKLKGVTATRQEISKEDGVYVKIFSGPQDKRGGWKKVGDAVNGLTIREITPEAVVFVVKQGAKEYAVELPRR